MIYAIGSAYGSANEKLPDFIQQNVACIGWPPEEAPGLHQMLAQIGVGDIIFIKAFPPSSGLHIKAVGVVTSPKVYEVPNNLGWGRSVTWVWDSLEDSNPVHLGRIDDRYDNLRVGTIYQEFGPMVQERVIDILLNPGNY